MIETKRYEIIYLDDEMYMLSDNFECPISKRAFTHNAGCIGNVFINYGRVQNAKDAWEILATTDKSLNLPLLPEVEEDVYKLADNFCNNTVPKDVTKSLHYAFRAGYKAASAKKYSDEDVVNFLKFLAKDHSHKYYTTKDAWDDFKYILELKPIAINVEMICSSYTTNGRGEERKIIDNWVPCTTNNIIKGYYIYE